MSEKIDELEENNTQKFTQLLGMFGKFRPTTSPIPIHESANEVHNTATMSSSPKA